MRERTSKQSTTMLPVSLRATLSDYAWPLTSTALLLDMICRNLHRWIEPLSRPVSISVIMANLFNNDFQDFLKALRQCEVRYVLVGGYSVILHGYSRTTGDMDIWVEKTLENYTRLSKAFLFFGMPVFDMTADNFLYNPSFDVFTFGRQPVAIDIITTIKGLLFNETYEKASDVEVDGIQIRLIHYNHLLQAKQAAGRARDLDDLENLQRLNQ